MKKERVNVASYTHKQHTIRYSALSKCIPTKFLQPLMTAWPNSQWYVHNFSFHHNHFSALAYYQWWCYRKEAEYWYSIKFIIEKPTSCLQNVYKPHLSHAIYVFWDCVYVCRFSFHLFASILRNPLTQKVVCSVYNYNTFISVNEKRSV